MMLLAVDNTNDKNDAKEEKKSRLNTNLNRVERLVMWCFFALLVVSQVKFINVRTRRALLYHC
jgi:hypothetical protein